MKTCYLWVSDHRRQRIVYKLQWKVVWRQKLLQVCSVLQYFLHHRNLNAWKYISSLVEELFPKGWGQFLEQPWSESIPIKDATINQPTSIEALTPGNTSPSLKGFFPYIKGPIYRATHWPNQWWHRVLLSIKWKIWTLFFHWYPSVFCGLSGLDTTSFQSQEYFKQQKMLKNEQFSLAVELKFLDTFFLQSAAILRQMAQWHKTKARWSSE